MNIFVLDTNPTKAAQLQCDKHVVKMTLESAQMLCTAHRLLDGDDVDPLLYKAAHKKHPCTLWTMESDANYKWHLSHFYALAKEYEYRYGKQHLSFTKLWSKLVVPPKNISKGPMTQFRLAMGSNPECKIESDPVRSYQLFYKTKAERFDMKWTKREVPEFFKTKVK